MNRHIGQAWHGGGGVLHQKDGDARRYLLLIPELTPQHFTKDLGRIPLFLARWHRWAVTVASEDPVDVPVPLTSIAYGRGRWSSMQCIWREAPSTDVLQCMHFTWRTILRAWVFKWRNRHGVCYVKLDLDEPSMLHLESLARGRLWRWLFRRGAKAIDVLSVESSQMLERFRSLLERCVPGRGPSLLLLPTCGFSGAAVRTRLGQAHLSARTDILFVGRLGAWQKGTDILLAAFRHLSEILGVQATLTLIGPEAPEFRSMWARWGAEPETKLRVSVRPPIWDEEPLIDWYLGSRVFVLPSRYEGVPNVLMEAASCGCLLVTTPVGQASDLLTKPGVRGWSVPIGDVARLAEGLSHALGAGDGEGQRAGRIDAFSASLSWDGEVAKLHRALLGLLGCSVLHANAVVGEG